MCGRLISVIVLFVVISETWSACDPDKFHVQYAKECYPESYVKLQNFTATIDKDCHLHFKGCGLITKGFTSAKGTTEVKSNGLTIPLRTDLCKEINNPKKFMGRFASVIGLRCPEKPRKICADEKKFIDLTADLKRMGGQVAGETIVRCELTHEDGGKSCITAKFIVKA